MDLNEKNISNRKITNVYVLHDNTRLDFECFRKRSVEFENAASTLKTFVQEMKDIMLNRQPNAEEPKEKRDLGNMFQSTPAEQEEMDEVIPFIEQPKKAINE